LFAKKYIVPKAQISIAGYLAMTDSRRFDGVCRGMARQSKSYYGRQQKRNRDIKPHEFDYIKGEN
jgi:hypothetical protein